MSKVSNNKGFTLIEAMLSLTLVAIISVSSISSYVYFQNKNELDVTVDITVQTARRAQILSQAMAQDSKWGVSMKSNIITLFKGEDYTNRDIEYDEIFDIAPIIEPYGVTEVVFTKLYGEPETVGTLIIKNTNTNETRTININEKGIFDY